jgi:hypothetical protein
LIRDDLLVEQTGQPTSYDELAVLVMVLRARLEEVEARADRLERRTPS